MRRRIDCNYIAFLRHVFDKSKGRTRDPRTACSWTARCELVRDFSGFFGHGAVRSDFSKKKQDIYFEQTFFQSRSSKTTSTRAKCSRDWTQRSQ